jgi:hypothetical protein
MAYPCDSSSALVYFANIQLLHWEMRNGNNGPRLRMEEYLYICPWAWTSELLNKRREEAEFFLKKINGELLVTNVA